MDALKEKFFKLSLRERIVVLLLGAVVFYFAFDFAVLKPQAAKAIEAQSKLAQARAESAELGLQISRVERGDSTLTDRVVRLREEVQELSKRLELVEAVMQGLKGDGPLVGQVVSQMLRSNDKVSVVSLKLLPPQALAGRAGSGRAAPAPPSGASSPSSAASQLYRHGVQVTVKGRYADIVEYMRSIERNPRVFWSEAKFSVANYPESSITITIYITTNQQTPVLS